MGLRSVAGFLGGQFWIRPWSGTFIVTTLPSPAGRLEAPVEGGVLLQPWLYLPLLFSPSPLCFLVSPCVCLSVCWRGRGHPVTHSQLLDSSTPDCHQLINSLSLHTCHPSAHLLCSISALAFPPLLARLLSTLRGANSGYPSDYSVKLLPFLTR